MAKILGLDIGADSVQAVVLEESLKGEKITLAFSMPIKTEDRVETLRSVLAEFGQRNIEFDRLAVNVPGHLGSLRHIELPFHDQSKVNSVLPFELESEFADGVAGKHFWFHPVSWSPSEENTLYLCLAVQESSLHELAASFSASGLSPRILGYGPFAAFNAYAYKGHKHNDGLVILLDIGGSATSINLIHNGILVYSRYIRFGGHDFTASIAQELNMSFEDSEDLKLEYGMSEDAELAGHSRVNQALHGAMDILTKEIDLTLGSFTSQAGDKPILEIILYGGGSRLQGIKATLTEKYETNVIFGNPFQNLRVSTEIEGLPESYAVAVGLALQAISLTTLQHNLLLKRPPLDALVQKRLKSHCSAFFILSCFFVFCTVMEIWMVSQKHRQLTQAYQEETRTILEKQKENFNSLSALQKKIRERKKLLEEFSRSEKSPVDILNYLSTQKFADIDLILQEVHLENLESDTRVVLRGSVRSAADIRKLENSLRELSFIRQVVVGQVEQAQDSGRYAFREIDLIL